MNLEKEVWWPWLIVAFLLGALVTQQAIELYGDTELIIQEMTHKTSYFDKQCLGLDNLSLKVERDYVDGIYNCVNFSIDLNERLRENDIGSFMVSYHVNGNKYAHRVIALLIEPQTGELIPPQNYSYIRLVDDAVQSKN